MFTMHNDSTVMTIETFLNHTINRYTDIIQISLIVTLIFFFLVLDPIQDHTLHLVVIFFCLLQAKTLPQFFFFVFHDIDTFGQY